MQLIINNLTFKTIIGVLPWEQKMPQTVIINAILTLDNKHKKAFLSDELIDAVNYAQVCELIQDVCHNTKAKLLEHLLYKISKNLFDEYNFMHIELIIQKPIAVRAADGVGVKISISKADFAAW